MWVHLTFNGYFHRTFSTAYGIIRISVLVGVVKIMVLSVYMG